MENNHVSDDNIQVNHTLEVNVEEDLEAQYFGDLYIDNYKDTLFDVALKVYNNVPSGIESKYNLREIIMEIKGILLSKRNKFIRDLIPLWILFRKTYIL